MSSKNDLTSRPSFDTLPQMMQSTLRLFRIAAAICSVAALVVCSRAEDNKWGLVFRDDFTRHELGMDWFSMDGEWKIENNGLVCLKGGSMFINRDLPGCQRLEFEAQTEIPGDISPFLQTDGRDVYSGYFLQFGGYNNTLNKGRRLAEYITFDQEHMIEKGKWHRLVAEFDGEHVRLTVDGQIVHDYDETDAPLLGAGHDRAGIYVYTQARIKNVKAYTKAFQSKPKGALQSKSTGFVPMRSPVAGTLLRGGDGEDHLMFVKWGGPVTRTTNDAHSGVAALQLDRITSCAAPGLVEINWSKRYELSGWFKSANPVQPSRVLLDMRFFTADRRPIDNWAIQPVTTTSMLLADMPVGTKILRVKKREWPADIKDTRLAMHTGMRLALNARDDLSDLPNFETVPINGFEEKESCYEITLSEPLKRSMAAGTGVRLHRYLDYPRVSNNHVPMEWTRYAFAIADKPATGARPETRFWPGTKYAGVVIIHQYSGYPAPLPEGEDAPILFFDDLMFREAGDVP